MKNIVDENINLYWLIMSPLGSRLVTFEQSTRSVKECMKLFYEE